MLSELGREFREDMLLSRVDVADHLNQILGRHALEHIAASTRLKGTLDFNIAFKRCQHDDSGVGELRSYRNHRVDAAHIGKPEVHEGDIGLVLPKLLDRFTAAG